MKTKPKLVALALPLAFGLQSLAFAQGSLTPPGPPGATMKSLDQVEPRTPISSVPFTISQPGSYYLTANVTVDSGDAISIAANNVTLDLNGFTISSTAANAVGSAVVFVSSSPTDVQILNGFIKGGVTNNAGVYSGTGFAYGITAEGNAPANVRVTGVSVSGCLYGGILLGTVDSSIVESCTVRVVGSYGISARTVSRCIADQCGTTAISAISADNCYGSAISGYGVYSFNAQNCYGSGLNGTGVYAVGIAQNCYGSASSGTVGVSALIAQNCYGVGGTYGLVGAEVAIGCYGHTDAGIALVAYVANSCAGSTQSIAYKYNMP
jgi:hypothetical protein